MTSWLAVLIPIAIMGAMAVSAEIAWARELKRKQDDHTRNRLAIQSFCKALAARHALTFDSQGVRPALDGVLGDCPVSVRFTTPRNDGETEQVVQTLRVHDALIAKLEVRPRHETPSIENDCAPRIDPILSRVYSVQSETPDHAASLLDAVVCHALLALRSARLMYHDGVINLSWPLESASTVSLAAIETGIDALAALARTSRAGTPFRAHTSSESTRADA